VAAVVAGALVVAAVVAELRPEIAALIRGYFPKYVKYTVQTVLTDISFSSRFTAKKYVVNKKQELLC